MKRIFFMLFMVLISISCDNITTSIEIIDDERPVRNFKIDKFSSDLSNSETISVETKLMASGSKVIIYAQSGYSGLSSIPQNRWDSVASEFDKHYDKLINIYGTHTDVDVNEKVILVFHIMPNGLGGYFTSADLFPYFKRNNAEIINVNIDFLSSGFNITTTMDTVFHEFQHLINFNMTSIKNSKLSSTWLNEALSESVYFVYKNGLPNTNRFQLYNFYDTSTNISKGANFYTFDGLESYVTASMFMYWLYLHGNGNTIIKNIAQGVNNYDYNAVVNAVNLSSTFTTSLAATTWSDILEAWLEANYVNNPTTTSIKGYKNKYIFTPKQVKNTTKVSLYPGGAVYTESYAGTLNTDIIGSKNITKGTTTWKLVYNKSIDETDTKTDATVAWTASLKNDTSLNIIKENYDYRTRWVDIVKRKVE